MMQINNTYMKAKEMFFLNEQKTNQSIQCAMNKVN